MVVRGEIEEMALSAWVLVWNWPGGVSCLPPARSRDKPDTTSWHDSVVSLRYYFVEKLKLEAKKSLRSASFADASGSPCNKNFVLVSKDSRS